MDAITIVQRTNYYEIHNGWVCQACLVRHSDGTESYVGIPSHRIGSLA